MSAAATTLGSFSGSFDWIADPPLRCELTFQQACDLLRLAIAGEPNPYNLDAQQILSDLALIGQNEINRWRRAADHWHDSGASAEQARAAAWRIVYAAGKRLTIRTADLRCALEGVSA